MHGTGNLFIPNYVKPLRNINLPKIRIKEEVKNVNRKEQYEVFDNNSKLPCPQSQKQILM